MNASYRLVGIGSSVSGPLERTAATAAEAFQGMADLRRMVGKFGNVTAYSPDGRSISFHRLKMLIVRGRGDEAVVSSPKATIRQNTRLSHFARINQPSDGSS